MRILVYCDEDLGLPGGGPRQVLELARALAARGHAVRVVAPRPGDDRAAGAALRGLPLEAVPVLSGPGFRPLSFLFASRGRLKRLLRAWAPDVLLWFDSPGQIAPLGVTRRLGCPYVLFVNGLPSQELRPPWSWLPLAGLIARELRAAARQASAVVSVCEEIVEELAASTGIPKERCRVVRNGVDPELFRPVIAAAAREGLGLPTEGPYVGFVGGFFPWHAVDLLIEAVPAVLEKAPRTRFLLVGDGQTREALMRRARTLGIEGVVRFPGRVGFDDVPRWIGACDVCVVLHRPTRRYPGDAMKLWEYLACGRPVVATAGRGYGGVLESLGAGVSVKPEDPIDLAECLVRLLGNGATRARMGEHGREAVRRHHTWAHRAAELETVLSGVGASRRMARP